MSTKQVQIIDENQAFKYFNLTSKQDDFVELYGLHDIGFNYHLVSVFGSQSTGKSIIG